MNIDDNDILNKIHQLDNELKLCTTKYDFNKLRKCIGDVSREIEKLSGKLIPYQKQKLSTALEMLNKLVITKDGEINGQKFKFCGEPIAPTSGPVMKSERTTSSTTLENGVSNIHKMRKIINSKSSHLLLKKFDSSIISSDRVFPSIHIQDGKDSILYLESDGPIFMHTLTNVTLFVKCHQLRLHNIKNCTLLTNVSNNRVIIEDCTNLKIGSFSRDTNEKLYVDDFNRPNLAENGVNYKEVSDYGIYDVFPWIDKIGEGYLSNEVIGKMISFVK